MRHTLDRLKTVGMTLSHHMKQHSSDFRVGFGSFVDKPVSPYINMHPSKIMNPCSDYEVNCRPAHGFIHVLPITENMTQFKQVIQQQRISGNMDTPEGGFDAMLQAAVCQDIGWRPEAKHLLLMMTDQPSHLALDSRLAGIVVPHDGRCHLVDSTYSQAANMEHPTMGQLAEKLLESSIYSIFAVDVEQYKWYEDLVQFLPGTYLGKLLPKAANLTNIVLDAYKKLLSDVGVEVGIEDSEAHRFWVNITALCPNGSTVTGNGKCSNVKPSQKVVFNVTVGMRECPPQRSPGGAVGEVAAVVRPVGFNETVSVRIRPACECGCGGGGSCGDGPEPPSCSSAVDGCREEEGGAVCGGRGACVCGTCVCDRSNLGIVHGKYCERDDFSCPYSKGVVCGGHGQCVSGYCLCRPGWTGDSCSCPTSTDGCVDPTGLVCSGVGECVCGECVCHNPRRWGPFCETCPTCSNSCQSQWSCVECHLSNGVGRAHAQRCNRTCTALVAFVDDITELIRGEFCQYQSREQCFFRFHVQLGSQGPHLRISRHGECMSSWRYFHTFLSVFLLTVVLGLGILAVTRLLLRAQCWPWSGRVSQRFDDNRKDYAPTTGEKTITYRRDCLPDNPMEMHVHVPKMPLNDAWP
ncbi:integrin beta-8 isoform X2 [Brachyhypopomus gauderio]